MNSTWSGTIPIYIISFNLLTWPRELAEWFDDVPGTEVILVDNASTYEPLLNWYDHSCPYKTVRLNGNFGKFAAWSQSVVLGPEEHQRHFGSEYYVITDPDLSLQSCPKDLLNVLKLGLDRHPDVDKAGLSLEISDLPNHYPFVDEVRKMEGHYWRRKRDEIFFEAPVDTTFALYSIHTPHHVACYPGNALRSDPPYCARHLSWYLDPESLPEEQEYYLMRVRNGRWGQRLGKIIGPKKQYEKDTRGPVNHKPSVAITVQKQRNRLIRHYLQASRGVLHLGAHIGTEAPYYAQFNKPVIWVEALHDVFLELKANIGRHSNQRAMHALLADQDDVEHSFFVSSNRGASSSIFEFGRYSSGPASLWPNLNLEMISKQTLTSVTLDTLLARNEVDPSGYDFWILDLQGAEKMALEGAARCVRHCRAMMVEVSTDEVHKNGVLWPELKNYLERLGFRQAWEPRRVHDEVLFVRFDAVSVQRFFWSTDYQQHNQRRLEHLDTLGLELANRDVLEVGAGVGDHTEFYLRKGCTVTVSDARPENLVLLGKRFADRSGRVYVQYLDLDYPEGIGGSFDVVHCYGVLYHLQHPEVALRFLARHCAGLLILETCVSFGEDEALNPEKEMYYGFSQGFSGVGCKPTRPWIWSRLKFLFPFVYTTRTQPHHEEFPLDWTLGSNPRAKLSRSVFVASTSSLSGNRNLLSTLPPLQEQL